MKMLFAAAAIAATLPAQAFFREGDFKPVQPATTSTGHLYQCMLEVSFTEARPELATVAYTEQPMCVAADALAMRYALGAAYCSIGDGSLADDARCIARLAPARMEEEPGPFSKATGSCTITILYDALRPSGGEIHWPGGCARAPLLLGMRYATTAVLCKRTTHCIAGPAWATLALLDADPKVYAPRPSSGPKSEIR